MTLERILKFWAHMPVWATRLDWPCLCGPHGMAQNPHAQSGLARMTHTATLTPLHNQVLRMTTPSSITQLYPTHGRAYVSV